MKRIIITFLAFLCACEQKPYSYYSENFIYAYFDYQGITLTVNQQTIFVSPIQSDRYTNNSTDADIKQKYESLAKGYGDLNYDRDIVELAGEQRNTMAANSITSIKIECLDDINKNHPAGSSVNDLFEFMAYSPLMYIQSGYTQTYDIVDSPYYQDSYEWLYYQSPNEWLYYFPIVKNLSDIDSMDLVLIGNGKSLNHILFSLTPQDKDNCPAWGKKLRLTLNYENQYPISKDFILEEGEY